MNADQFLHRCRTLWHVGAVGSWEGIQRMGLRTAEQLIESADLDEARRVELLSAPRRTSVLLTVDGGAATLRDQGPLLKRKDVGSLMGDALTLADWIRILNRRVYLFTNRTMMEKLLNKYVELDGAQEVITFSPLKVYELCHRRIELSAQNSGAIARVAGQQKHRDTFVPVGLFADKPPSEVTVVNGIDSDELAAVAFVERRYANGTKEKIGP